MLPGKREHIARLFFDDRPDEAVEEGRYLRVFVEIAGLVRPDVILVQRADSVTA